MLAEIPGTAELSLFLPTIEASAAHCGVACLLFGVGAGGAGWLTRLARSGWFAGLEPRTAVPKRDVTQSWAGEFR